MKLRFLSLLFPLIVSSATAEVVYRVPIQSTIDLGLPPFIERAVEQAESEGADAIVFDIDTFGGRVDGATQIKDAILDSKVLTVAFINRRAISAGALISLSCERIYMTDGGTIGAATAVDMSGKKGSEKVISYMREEMASTAESRGRSEEIARGMVDEELKFTHLVVDGDSIEVTDIEGRKDRASSVSENRTASSEDRRRQHGRHQPRPADDHRHRSGPGGCHHGRNDGRDEERARLGCAL